MFWGEQSKGKLRQISAAHEEGESGGVWWGSTPPPKKKLFTSLGTFSLLPGSPQGLWRVVGGLSLSGFFAL